jgi:hypothetical protein
MPEMTKTDLNRIVKHYVKSGDKEGAKNYIKTFGPAINDYDVAEELKKIE